MTNLLNSLREPQVIGQESGCSRAADTKRKVAETKDLYNTARTVD
jgi:hypothetical protein